MDSERIENQKRDSNCNHLLTRQDDHEKKQKISEEARREKELTRND